MFKKMLFAVIALIVTFASAFYKASAFDPNCDKCCGVYYLSSSSRDCDAGPAECKVANCLTNVSQQGSCSTCYAPFNHYDVCGGPSWCL